MSWSVLQRGYTRILSLLRIIILARFFLSPYEFGLFGIITLILSFLEILTETGVNVFLIQEKENFEKYINSAWIVSIVRGIIIACILCVFAYPSALFFKSSPVTLLLITTAIIPFIRGFINPTEVIFQKELYFKKEFIFRSIIFTIESLAIILFAFLMHNAYALVFGMIVSAFSEVLISFLFIKPTPRFKFNFDEFKKIFHKGKWVTMYSIFQYFAENGDDIVVGRILGTSPLAIYQTAYSFSTLPVSEITDVVSKVTFPVFTKIGGDRDRLLKAFLKTTIFISIFSILLGLFIILFPTQIILATIGAKWLSVASLLPLLTIYGICRAIFGSFSTLFLSVGKQKFVAVMTFVRSITLVLTVVPLTLLFGLEGTVIAALISVLVEIPVILYNLQLLHITPEL